MSAAAAAAAPSATATAAGAASASHVRASLVYDSRLAAQYPQALDTLAQTPPTPTIELAVGEPNAINRTAVGGGKIISRSGHAEVSVSPGGEVTVTAAKSGTLRINEESDALEPSVARTVVHGDVVWLLVDSQRPTRRLFPYRLAVRHVRPLLVFTSPGADAAGAIEIDQDCTLADVRSRVLEEFDEDQLPTGVKDGTVQFYFQVDGVRLSGTQERLRSAWHDCDQVVVRAKVPSERPPSAAATKTTAAEEEAPATAAAATAKADEEARTDAVKKADGEEAAAAAAAAAAASVAPAQAEVLSPLLSAASGAVAADVAASIDGGTTSAQECSGPSAQLVSRAQRTPSKADHVEPFHDDEMPQSHGCTDNGSADQEDMEQEQQASQVCMLPSDCDSDLSEDDEEELAALDLTRDDGDAEQIGMDGVRCTLGATASGVSDTAGDEENAAVYQSMKRCTAVTSELRQLLTGPDVAKLAGEERRKQWLQKLDEMKTATLPETVVGVIGNTGVGKSSLLNALLGEASILPTSGSRGCTAAVVQLLYNAALSTDSISTAVPVYEGVVEFISKEEWEAELDILIDECSTEEGKIYTVAPSESLGSQENVLEAWQKIETVYGHGTLSKRCRDGISKERMLQILKSNTRVNNMLSQKICIQEGSVYPGSEQAKALLLGASAAAASNKLLKKKRSEWAKEFRRGINEFVYRRGNGTEPQDWPLIRQVTLKGPWPVLSAGAQLVDLPGVRDANAARAKVAESFLKNCNNVWVVAPIKRAVDDGTAKELMGDAFKRRLLMDGNYGNVAFICTQTDDVEPTEIWRDHRDVAQSKPGRHDRMQALFQELRACESKRTELGDENDERAEAVEEAKKKLRRQMRRQKDAEDARDNVLNPPPAEDADSPVMGLTREQPHRGEQATGTVEQSTVDHKTQASDLEQNDRIEVVDEDVAETEKTALLSQLADEITAATAEVEVLKREWRKAKRQLKDWLETTHGPLLAEVQKNVERIQRQLKPLCAQVRNEYSTAELQKDFKAGFADLTRQDAEEEHDDDDHTDNAIRAIDVTDDENAASVEESELEVFCISANDYLKVTKIKDRSDGPPVTFHNVNDTNIPQLIEFVHAITLRRRKTVAERLLELSSEFLSGVKLYLSDDGTADESLRAKTKAVFDCELAKLEKELQDRAAALLRQMLNKIEKAVKPGMKKGAEEGQAAAKLTAESWGSKDRRTKHDRAGGGLFWSTYFATLRRDGVFVSPSCGAIDMNQELSDPVEEKMMVGWDSTMNSAMKVLLEGFGASVEKECERGNEAIAAALALAGVNVSRLGPTKQQASRTLRNKIKDGVAKLLHHATERQREINRMMTPNIKEQMTPGYAAGVNVERGQGRFGRMKCAVMAHVSREFTTMFAQATKSMLQEVHQLAKDLSAKAFALLGCLEAAPSRSVELAVPAEPVLAALQNLYSQFWEGQQTIDPAARQAAVAARKMTLPQLAKFERELLSVMRDSGMDRLLSAVEKWQRDYDDALERNDVVQTASDGSTASSDTTVGVEILGEVTAEQRTAAAKAAAVNLCDDSSDNRKRQAAEQASTGNIKRQKLVAERPVHESEATEANSDNESSGSKNRRSTLVGEQGLGQSKRFKATELNPRGLALGL